MFKNSSTRKGSPGGSARNVPHTRIEEENEIEEMYEFRRELGRGSFGRVYEAQCRKTGTKWAIKAVNKEKVLVINTIMNVNIYKEWFHSKFLHLSNIFDSD